VAGCDVEQRVDVLRSHENLVAMKTRPSDPASSSTNVAGKTAEFQAATVAVSTAILSPATHCMLQQLFYVLVHLSVILVMPEEKTIMLKLDFAHTNVGKYAQFHVYTTAENQN